MGPIALVIATLLYVFIGIDNFLKKDYPHALIWLAYALANLGFLWWEIQKIKNGV